jgi:MtfA peptidase
MVHRHAAMPFRSLLHPLRALSRWRRGHIMRRHAIDDDLWRQVVSRLPALHPLGAAERNRLREITTLFLAHKRFAGTHGFVVEPHMQLTIAVQACLLILNLGLEFFRGWRGIVVYETGFLARHEYEDEDGLVYEVTDALDGEAWDRGPVVLSWAEIDPERPRDDHEDPAFNVVFHEFAHKLDFLNGDANGCPPLHRTMSPAAWKAAFLEAYETLCWQVEHDQPTPIDPYGAESPGELFAVTTEYFFSEPQHLRAVLPQVYDQLTAFYCQDPAARADSSGRLKYSSGVN